MTDRKHRKHGDRRGAAGDAAEQAAAPAAGEAAAGGPGEAAEPGDEAADDLGRVTAERDEYLDHLQRLKAEFDNYRKRVQRDNEELRLRAAETVVESLLPVMDNMARALQAAREHEGYQLTDGLQLVADQLHGSLQGHGLEEIDVEPGSLFDPNYHEAVLTQSSADHDEGVVVQVLERGYLLHGRLLRPAKVIVAS
jgi:molecular chaperone GrpE